MEELILNFEDPIFHKDDDKVIISNLRDMMKARGIIDWKKIVHKNKNCYTCDNDIIIMYCKTKLNKEFMRLIQITEYSHIIILYKTSITSCVNPILEEMKSEKYIEIFDDRKFLYNPTTHYLVPKHTNLDNEERQSVIKKYGASSLPIMSIDDVISRYYDFRKGDVISIKRKDGSLMYRIVV